MIGMREKVLQAYYLYIKLWLVHFIQIKIFSFTRLEQKIKDLESQLDDEQRRLVDAQKSQRRTERRIKELTFSQDEDHKNHERMQELVEKLQNKV